MKGRELKAAITRAKELREASKIAAEVGTVTKEISAAVLQEWERLKHQESQLIQVLEGRDFIGEIETAHRIRDEWAKIAIDAQRKTHQVVVGRGEPRECKTMEDAKIIAASWLNGNQIVAEMDLLARFLTLGAGEGTDPREGATLTGREVDPAGLDKTVATSRGSAQATAMVTASGRDSQDSLTDRGPKESVTQRKKQFEAEIHKWLLEFNDITYAREVQDVHVRDLAKRLVEK